MLDPRRQGAGGRAKCARRKCAGCSRDARRNHTCGAGGELHALKTVRSSSAQHQATGGAGVVNCGLDAHFRVGSRPRARPCACARSKRAALLRLLVPRHDGAAKGPQCARLRRQMTSSLRQVRDVLLARSRQQPRAGMLLGMVRRADASRAYCRAVRGRPRTAPGDATRAGARTGVEATVGAGDED